MTTGEQIQDNQPEVVAALLRASRSVLHSTSFEETARVIFDEACRLTGARSGYVALLDETGEENEVLFLEAGGLPCTVDPDLPMPIRGLREVSYRENRVAFDNDFMHSEWLTFMPAGHVPLRNVMFSPLVIDGRTQGIMGLANKPGDFDARDAELAGALGDVCAIALRRNRTLEQLRKSEDFLTRTGTMARVGGWEVDLKQRTVHWSEVTRQIHEVPEEYQPSLDEALDFFPGESKQRVRALMERAIERGEAYDEELEFETRKKRRLWVRAIGHPEMRDGACVRLAGTFQDITDQHDAAEERRLLDEQLQHAQKLESLGVLAGGIAHDFANILLAIIGNASLALDDLPSTSPVRENLEQIERSARHATDLCKQMLAYSGKGRFVVKPIDLNAVVEEMTQMLQVSITKKALLRLDLAAGLPGFDGDVSQITQVIMNLITNASDAIGDRSGAISIRTGAMACDHEYLAQTFLDDRLQPGEYVFLEVADTGCGMDEETRARMFEPFFSTKFTGRGLGLAAVLGIVRGHNGAIKVYSEPDQGTTIKVLLPVSASVRAETEQRVAAAMEGPWRGSGAVLVADDEETVRTVARQTLQRAGFEVIVTEDGREALERFRERGGEIVCVLLDLTMPHLDGEQAFRELRKLREDVPVLMSSGYSEDSVSTRFAGKGLAGFIQKPYRPDELIAKVREILEPQGKPSP